MQLVLSEYSVISIRFYRFYRITRELKNPVAKCYPHWRVNPITDFPLPFMFCMLPSELILLFAGSLNAVDPCEVMFYWFLDLEKIWNQ